MKGFNIGQECPRGRLMALKISSSLGLDQNIPNKSIFELCFSSIRFNCIYVYPVQEITQEKGAGCFLWWPMNAPLIQF